MAKNYYFFFIIIKCTTFLKILYVKFNICIIKIYFEEKINIHKKKSHFVSQIPLIEANERGTQMFENISLSMFESIYCFGLGKFKVLVPEKYYQRW